MSDSKSSSSNKSGSGNTNNHSNNNNNNNNNNSNNNTNTNNRDDIYRFDSDHISLMRKDKPWERDNKFFKHCKVSALAAIKMLKHALSGVEKGKKQGRPPVEVMGLMIGKMEGDSIIVMDCCPLPVEGTETKVVAEDAAPYMTELLDSLEKRRNEGFTGWYHSHPFDVESYSHCHLSSTDVQTQSAWQFSLPSWTAIVVDPLRSLAKQEPEFGAFRVYPAKYNPPANEQPDGSIMTDELSRAVRWGNSHNRYYSMKISYFMSSLGTNLLDTMSKNNLWVRVLSSSTIMETDNRQRFAERVRKAAEKIDNADNVSQSSGTLTKFSGGGSSSKKKGANEELTRVSQTCAEIGVEQCKGHCSQIAKDLLFNIIAAHIEKEKAQEAAVGSH